MTMQEEREVTIYDSDPVEDVRRAGRNMLVFAGSSLTIFFIGLIIYLLELIKAYLIYLSYLALAGAGVVILCVIAAPVIFLLRWLFDASAHDVGPNGLAFRGLFGRIDTVAPMNTPAGVKLAPERKKKDAPVIPLLSMLDMIEQGIISPGQVKVILGYTDKNELEVQRRPNVYVIAGKGRSGKSRRATLMIGQDLIALAPLLNLKDRTQGARVMICDPHGLGKKDSLRRLLEPLTPWIEFASTEQEVRKLTSEYIEEMERRLGNTSMLGNADGSYIPWVLYYDEWSRFMTKYDDDFTALLTNAVQSSAQEYAGVDGYVALLGQDWTQDACGGTAIRRAIQEAFIHNISSEYAKFFLKGVSGNRWAAKAESLRVKDCIYRSFEGQIKQLTTPHVADEVPARLAEIMQELCPVEIAPSAHKEIPESTARPKSPGEPPSYSTWRNTDHLPEQMAQYPAMNYPMIAASIETRTLENEVSALGASISSSHVERESTISLPEASSKTTQETGEQQNGKNTEAANGSNQPMINNAIYKAALRDIARRLERGEDPIAIRKSLEINGGRALQEVNAALRFLDQSKNDDTEVTNHE